MTHALSSSAAAPVAWRAGSAWRGPGRQAAPIAKADKFVNIPGQVLGGATTFRPVIRGLVYAAVYFAAMVSAILATRFGGGVAPIWIASAVFAWNLVAAPVRDWPILIVLTALAHMLGAYAVGDQWTVEIVYLLANLTSPIVFAAATRAMGGPVFEDTGSVIRFVMVSAGSALASTLIVASAALIERGAVDLRETILWFLSDGLSFVVFVPIFLTMASGDWRDLLAAKVRGRAALLFGLLLATHAIAFVLPNANLYRVLLLLLIPYSVYIAFRLGFTGARATIAVSAIMIVAYLMFATPPVDRSMTPQEFIIAMQIYLAVTCASVLPLAAALAEKDKLYESASGALHDAQAAWGELIAAEAHYRLIADNVTDMILRLDLDGAILFASPACSALSVNPEHLTGRRLADLARPDDAEAIRAEFASLVAEGALDRPHAMPLSLRGADGAWGDYDLRATLVAPGGGEPGELIAVLRPTQRAAA